MLNRRRVALVGWVAVVAVALGVLWTCKPQPTIEPQPRVAPGASSPRERARGLSRSHQTVRRQPALDRELGADSEMVDFERGQIGTGILAVIEPDQRRICSGHRR